MACEFSRREANAGDTVQRPRSTHRPVESRWRAPRGALLVTAILSLAFGSAAAGHDFWIQPGAFWVPLGGSTSLSILVGHGTFRETSLIPADRVTRFDSVGATGRDDRRRELKLGSTASETMLRFLRPGLQVLTFETNGTYSELPGLRFTDYLKVEGLSVALEQRARNHTSDAPGKEVYSRRAKALVEVGMAGATDDAIAMRPTGSSLEIVPGKSPYAIDFNGELPVQVLFQGKPLAGALVKLNNLDFDERPIETHVSDATGRTIFHVPRIGSWQLNVIWTKPIVGDAKADFETTFSSLTFGFPRAKTIRRAP